MDNFLVDHINKGWSYLAIAKALSASSGGARTMSRNAIAGRKHRLIVAGREMLKPDHQTAVTHSNKLRGRKPKERKEKKVLTPKKHNPVISAPAAEVIRIRNPTTGQLKAIRPGVLPMTANPKTITELGRRQCRAAVGEAPRQYDGINNPFVFCGARTEEGEAYCPDHAFLMYAKPKPRSERGFMLGRIGTNKGAA